MTEPTKPTVPKLIEIVGSEEATPEKPSGVYVDGERLPFLVGAEISVNTTWPIARSLVTFTVLADEVKLPKYVSLNDKEVTQ